MGFLGIYHSYTAFYGTLDKGHIFLARRLVSGNVDDMARRISRFRSDVIADALSAQSPRVVTVPTKPIPKRIARV